jgi:hypothetical protein
MIYTYEDNHPIIKAIKKRGWVLFMVTKNKISDGITGGVWIDCCDAYDTEHYESHKKIHGLYLGNTLKDALKEVKSDRFPIRQL